MNFNDSEVEVIFSLAEQITGSCQKGRFRRDVLVSNISRLIEMCGYKDLNSFIASTNTDKSLKAKLVSALTIHTTSWFREDPHYNFLLKNITKNLDRNFKETPYLVWSTACSTGEECYSIALVLEKYRKENPHFEYLILGSDIDPVSIVRAENAVYSTSGANLIPDQYQEFIFLGSGKTFGYMTLDPEIRKRTKFKVWSFVDGPIDQKNNYFDVVFCRNVLIYFESEKAQNVTLGLRNSLKTDGLFILGHSEPLEKTPADFKFLGHSVYEKQSLVRPKNERVLELKKIKPKILVIDDSNSVRKVIKNILIKNHYDVIEASNPEEADSLLKRTKVHGVTLDLNMGSTDDGVRWLEKARKSGFAEPVIIVTDARPDDAGGVISALEVGAQDYIFKKQLSENPDELNIRMTDLISNHLSHSKATTSAAEFISEFELSKPECILIGASTGGPEAIVTLLNKIGDAHKLLPPIVIVQHISPLFSKALSKRISEVSKLTLGEPIDGTILKNNHIYMSHDDYHLGVSQNGSELSLIISNSDKILGHRPAVDYLFTSASKIKAKTLAILLTGMGRDGAQGMLKCYQNKNFINFAQNESSCVVFGMPKEAIALGAVHFSGNLKQIRAWIDRAILVQSKNKAA